MIVLKMRCHPSRFVVLGSFDVMCDFKLQIEEAKPYSVAEMHRSTDHSPKGTSSFGDIRHPDVVATSLCSTREKFPKAS